jgi:diguanylate cyclase (GGDEF)-like protein
MQDRTVQDPTMEERRKAARNRSLLQGKILINDRRSVIDCVVHNLSQHGACLRVASLIGIPPAFELQIGDETSTRQCVAIWHSDARIGVEFRSRQPGRLEPGQEAATAAEPEHDTAPARAASTDLVRGELLSLRAALYEVPYGVVLLDNELRAQFINRAFRKMWRLPDSNADAKPAYIALLHHGRDIRAYHVPDSEMKAYIADRVARVRVGDPTPVDLRQANGEVIRFHCTALPNGGRMLSYTYVTDIVQQADELQNLKNALDNVEQGVSLLDPHLRVQFMNRAARKMWKVSDDIAEKKLNYAELVNTTRLTHASGVPQEELDKYIAERITTVRNGDPTPADVILSDGRTVRLQCAVLPNGGRMLTYSDVSDLVREAAEQHHFATTDSMTDLHNRRHFLTLAAAEWQRFQRYQRPLSLLMFDIDHFKFINDKLGHDAGDRAIVDLAGLARTDKRPTDIVARIGGDEFVMLLPETDVQQASTVAERLRQKVSQATTGEPGAEMKMTISVGVASATLSMSGIQALLKQADEALYRAKFLGRNKVSLANPPPVTKVAAE